MNECAGLGVACGDVNGMRLHHNQGIAEEREIYSGGAYCSLLKVNHVRGAFASRHADKDAEEEEREKQKKKHNLTDPPSTPSFLIPTKDGTITNVTLTGGDYPSLH